MKPETITNWKKFLNHYRKDCRENNFHTILLTKELAPQLLFNQRPNRAVSKSRIDKIVKIIKSKSGWKINGEPLSFNKKGQLLEGQGRVHAVIKCGISIPVDVRLNLEDNVFTSINTGKHRSKGDILGMAGFKNASVLGTAIEMVLASEAEGLGLTMANYPRSPQDLMEGIDQHPEIVESVDFIMTECRKLRRFANRGMCAGLHFLFCRHDYEDATDFFKKLTDGSSLETSDPIYKLRERLRDSREQQTKMTGRYTLALYIKCWNAYLAGETIKNLMWRAGGAKPEAFPKIK